MNERRFSIAIFLSVAFLAGCGERYSYLTYKEVIFQGPTTTKIIRMYPREPDKIPSLFVRTPNGEVFKLDELPEAVVSKLDGARHTNNLGLDQYFCGGTMLEYKRGRLVTFTFGEGPLKIGAKRNGPFREFPMSRDGIHEMFGDPEREGRASKPSFEWK
jgi:hypothetical protein